MQQYIGTKLIAANPMTRLAYNEFRGWDLPNDEDGAVEGYLVEYLDGGKPNVEGYAGYVSWSPKAQFEAAYRPVDGLSFGLALESLRKGFAVARAGWNGQGMWISMSCGPIGDAAAGKREVAYENLWSKNNSEYARKNGGSATVLPCITMKTANGEIQMGWAPSQADMFGDDWMIVSV